MNEFPIAPFLLAPVTLASNDWKWYLDSDGAQQCCCHLPLLGFCRIEDKL